MENNKILLEVYVPSIEKEYDVFVPISKRIGTINYEITCMISRRVSRIYHYKNNTYVKNYLFDM